MKRSEMHRADLDDQIVKLLDAIANDLHSEFGGGALSPSAYDTAWVAMVRDPANPDKLAFPSCFAGLLALQCPDGSFGAPYPYTIVPTLAALLCLKKAPEQEPHTRLAAERARVYLERVFPEWDVAQHETIAFEMLVPMLLRHLVEYGIEFAFPQKRELLMHQEAKMVRLSPERVYGKHSTLAHSLEALGGRLDFDGVRTLRSEVGCYGGSPAATAAALLYGSWDNQAARWIEYVARCNAHGQTAFMPPVFGIDTFEICWALHFLHFAGYVDATSGAVARNAKFVKWLEAGLSPDGIGVCAIPRTVPVDGDDTALALASLSLLGTSPDLAPLLHFEDSDHFLCYEGERGASTSTNAHVLYTLMQRRASVRHEMQSRIDKTTAFLLRHAHPDGYWRDKWHASPLYATSCAVIALAECVTAETNAALDKALQWVLDSQHVQSGGWGMLGDCTAEETAYALMVLFCLQDHRDTGKKNHVASALSRGMTYLRQHAEPPQGSMMKRSSLWIAKELYTPSRVVEVAILSVLRRGVDIPSTTTSENPKP